MSKGRSPTLALEAGPDRPSEHEDAGAGGAGFLLYVRMVLRPSLELTREALGFLLGGASRKVNQGS